MLTILLLGSLGLVPASADQAERPNVLIIAVDDLNDWVGCLAGHPQTRTPNIDRLASKGILFANAHCQAPICGPSRASLWTGLYPHTTGIYGQIRSDALAEHPLVKDRARPYLPNHFADHGYRTMAVGKLFHGDGGVGAFSTYGGKRGGFGPRPDRRFHYQPPELLGLMSTSTDWGRFPESDEQMPDHHVANWAIEQLQQVGNQPWLMAVGFWRPHVPWYCPSEWFDPFPLATVVEPPIRDDDLNDLPAISLRIHEMPVMPSLAWMRQHDQVRASTQAYLACMAFVDHQVGRVLDALNQTGQAEQTIIVLWSDHGYHLGEKHRWAKHSLWEEATRVPVIIADPRIPGGGICQAPVGLIDLAPTLLDLAGLAPDPAHEGRSLSPLLQDPNSPWDRPILTTYGRKNHAIRTDRYRYIRYEDGSEELYDLTQDPNSWTNLAHDPRSANLKEPLAQSLPERNMPWFGASTLNCNTYFLEHVRLQRRSAEAVCR